jgi:hypothetical protein
MEEQHLGFCEPSKLQAGCTLFPIPGLQTLKYQEPFWGGQMGSNGVVEKCIACTPND